MSPVPIDRNTVLLLDLSSYIFRAYHAIRALSNRKGVPTNAVYGVARMLIRLLKDHPDANVVAVLDAPGPSWRAEVYPEYKANRPPAPEDLKVQIELVYRLVEALGIPTIMRDGYEADDLIAALARRWASAGRTVVIVSGDKDLMQLIDDGRIVMWDPMKDVWYDAAAVEKKWGVRPDQIADLFALMGDSSDNVPGVPGIGARRAAQLLQEYGSLEALLAHRDELPPQKWADNLRERPDLAEISYRIVHLEDLFPDEVFDEDQLRRRPPDREALERLLDELDFSSLRGDLDRIVAALTDAAAAPEDVPPPPHEMRAEIIHSADALAAWLQPGRLLGVDTETTSLQPRRARIVGISLADRADHGGYLPLAHQFGDNVSLSEVRDLLGRLFADEAIPKVGQNLKYDICVLRQAGFAFNGLAGDSMIASYLLGPDENSHGLDELARREFGVELISFKEVAPDSNFAATPVEEAARYAAEDAAVALALCERLHPRLREQELDRVYREIELPLVPVLADMEWHGIRVDTDALEALQRELQQRIHHIESEVTSTVGRAINLNSPAQIGELLFDELGLPTKGVRKTKTGKWSTKESVLEELRDVHPLVPKILEYRTLSKMLQTYAIGLRNAVLPETGRIHPSFQQTRTATGRLSCTDPNLQNIPVRDEWGRRLRAAFVADKGCLFVGADYSQIELRILAHFSEDPGLIEAFRTGQDIHSRTAAELFDVPPPQVSSEQRRLAKAINFGLMYGMGARRLAQETGIKVKEASQWIERYFERFPGIRAWRERLIAEAREQGFVRTLFGRKRWLPGLASGNRGEVAAAERMAVNTPIQGTAADIIKRAMIAIHRRFREEQLPARLLLQVHDELLVEAAADVAEQVRDIVVHEMQTAAELRVPLEVASGIGRHWGQAH